MSYTFAMGTNKVYEFLHNNPTCASYPVNYINDPRIMAMNDRVIAINNAMEVDLYGQACSDRWGGPEVGYRRAAGFHLRRLRIARRQGLICLSSTRAEKDGSVHSRIRPSITPGSIVTVPRSIIHYVVTEYGSAQLKANRLAAGGGAHQHRPPDFRTS